MQNIFRFLFVALFVVWPLRTEAIEYTFTKIADTSDVFRPSGLLPVPSINDSGLAAFFAVTDTGVEGIFTGVGGETSLEDYTTIADTNDGFSNFGFGVSINTNGVVAFGAAFAGSEGIFIGSGAAITTISTEPFQNIDRASAQINDSDIVAFHANISPFQQVILIGIGGPLNTIADTGDAFFDLGHPLRLGSINNSSAVVFTAGLSAGGLAVRVEAVTLLESIQALGDRVVRGRAWDEPVSPRVNRISGKSKILHRRGKKEKPAAKKKQDEPPCYDLNGSIYVWKRDWLFSGPDKAIGDETLLYVTPRECSADIDTELDFRIAEMPLSDQEPRQGRGKENLG